MTPKPNFLLSFILPSFLEVSVHVCVWDRMRPSHAVICFNNTNTFVCLRAVANRDISVSQTQEGMLAVELVGLSAWSTDNLQSAAHRNCEDSTEQLGKA